MTLSRKRAVAVARCRYGGRHRLATHGLAAGSPSHPARADQSRFLHELLSRPRGPSIGHVRDSFLHSLPHSSSRCSPPSPLGSGLDREDGRLWLSVSSVSCRLPRLEAGGSGELACRAARREDAGSSIECHGSRAAPPGGGAVPDRHGAGERRQADRHAGLSRYGVNSGCNVFPTVTPPNRNVSVMQMDRISASPLPTERKACRIVLSIYALSPTSRRTGA